LSKSDFSTVYQVSISIRETSATENENPLLVGPLRLLGLGLLLLGPPDGHRLVVRARLVRGLPLSLLAHFETLKSVSIKVNIIFY
jgi:hypothetical protein